MKADSVLYYLEQANKSLFNDFDEAIVGLKKCDEFVKDLDDPKLKAEIIRKWAIAYYVKGVYYKSLKDFLKAEKIYRSIDDYEGIGKCLNGLGLIQQGMERHNIAIEYFRQAIEYYNQSENKYAAAPAVINIGVSKLQLGHLDDAKAVLDSALIMSRAANRKDIEHLTMNHLGDLAYQKEEISTAINYFDSVLNDKSAPNNWEKSFAFFGLAESYFYLGNLAKAERNALEALNFAEINDSFYELEKITGILFNIYEQKGESNKALQYSKQHNIYGDSLYNQKRLRSIDLLNLESKEEDNRRLRLERMEKDRQLSRNKLIIAILLGVGVVLKVILFFRIKTYRQKEKFRKTVEEKNELIVQKNELITERNKELANLNKSKDRLFSILSHDLKSPIGSIQKLLELIKIGEFSEKEQAELLDEMLKQVSATSTMLQNLLQWANSQLEGSKMHLEEVVLPKRVREIMEAHYLVAKSKDIQIKHDIPASLSAIIVDKGHLSIILHNLVSNAIKFTHQHKEIKIHYEEDEEFVYFKIKDGGEGISEERIAQIQNFNTQLMSELGTNMETGTGIGLLLVKQFLEMNNATLDIKSYTNEGSEFIIRFRKKTD
ncbi:tetratricopeptide repeat-containing sensor histidine kinase [Zunongwangia endophytica]|uniref:histidine kinase n=1 Tax=Zunongwangia endophytica TaxID=1808945 RepID=A0ABV8HE02_9FLAO|nr:tetratricopeptide repeat-containing sensor histidine kinase [Zunongwangia endophytica]MDN3596690.1 tetratricopeptide repeat-containing sensor histidine kinase [Zunongwangia endophytica]